jgi:hypothetical protein
VDFKKLLQRVNVNLDHFLNARLAAKNVVKLALLMPKNFS